MLYEYTEKDVQQEDGRTGEDNILHQCRCGDSVWQCGCGDSVWTDVNALKKKAITINVILK